MAPSPPSPRSTLRALGCAAAVGLALVPPASAATAAQRMAVLTLTAPWSPECQGVGWRKDRLLVERCAVLDTLADEARAGALAALRGRPVKVMTRENTALLLKENGAGACTEGECEVETAKLIGADWVVSGSLTYVEKTWFATLKLHEVARATLLDATKVKARSQVELIEAVQSAAEELVRGGLGLGGGRAAAPVAPAPAPAFPRPEPPAQALSAAGCPPGQEPAGAHCCWPGQDWGAGAGRCLGTPRCPDAFVAQGDNCVPGCAGGKVIVAGHCCWPGQDWGERARQCIGTPTCGEGTFPDERIGCVRFSDAGMVRLPGGSYRMAEAGRTATVQPFLLDVTEVTVAAYAQCAQAGRCAAAPSTVEWPGISESDRNMRSPDCNQAKVDRMNHPVNCVDYGQAVAYCASLGKRLPTEDEWEWAARGAERGTTYPWGNDAPTNQLCWNGTGNDRNARGFGTTCAVGSYPRSDSPHGLKDLSGNVREWTSTTTNGVNRIPRGGSWILTDAKSFTASFPGWDTPETRGASLGFRCAKSL